MRDEMSNSQGCIDGEDADLLLDALDDKASAEEIEMRRKLSRERLRNSMKTKNRNLE